MRKKIPALLLIFSLLLPNFSRADEGMWLPLLISRNYEQMQRLGFKLTAEDIYNINRSSLKDAVVNFGGFCTGEIVSPEGLILTNHHCGYESIQSHSTVQNDYLSNGFWAMNRSQELHTPGLTVTFLVRMESVTETILSSIAGMSFEEREAKIEQLSALLESQATEGNHYTAEVKSFFEGNEFYLFVYEVFKDVRLVGAPPSSIGKFGGDTDNWMWPRHTGDFSFFRVYAAPDGKPADYSPNNVPLKPRYHFPISLAGVKEGDFSMVMGYPGNTDRYMVSEGVRMAYEITNPARVKIREKRLEIIKRDMDANPEVRINYAALYAQVSNYYKYFIGQNQGLKRLNVIQRKREEEQQFQQWVNADASRKSQYGNLISEYNLIYQDYRKVAAPYAYLEEAAFGPEILMYAYKLNSLYQGLVMQTAENTPAVISAARELTKEHFKTYNAETDRKVFAALLKMYYDDVDQSFHPQVFATVKKKYKGNFNRYADFVFKNSILTSAEKMNAFLDKPDARILEKDPAFSSMISILGDFRTQVGPALRSVYARLDNNNHLYLKALKEKRQNEKMYPDANFSMRVTYGNVKSYHAKDGVIYNYYTTIEGIIEKKDSTNEEFIVPAKLVELYKKKDYGRYGMNNTLPVNFISNTDITGGNSGSPVLNARGELIGCAFDGNWEAMSGDIIFEPELQRTISVDIRYILFIVDKFAGAGHLINEMTIRESDASASIEEAAPVQVEKPEIKKVKK
ncbi:MAG: S46 family peptidase [Cytophagaceae bacterium]